MCAGIKLYSFIALNFFTLHIILFNLKLQIY